MRRQRSKSNHQESFAPTEKKISHFFFWREFSRGRHLMVPPHPFCVLLFVMFGGKSSHRQTFPLSFNSLLPPTVDRKPSRATWPWKWLMTRALTVFSRRGVWCCLVIFEHHFPSATTGGTVASHWLQTPASHPLVLVMMSYARLRHHRWTSFLICRAVQKKRRKKIREWEELLNFNSVPGASKQDAESQFNIELKRD